MVFGRRRLVYKAPASAEFGVRSTDRGRRCQRRHQ